MPLITVSDKDKIRTIQINRPEKKNAINLEMYQLLTHALKDGDEDDTINLFILHGHSEYFCAGNDLKDFLNHQQLTSAHPTVQFLYQLIDTKKPLIASVSGMAIGIGTTILLHCDLIYAADNCRFQLPFVNLSLVPEAAASLIVPQLCGAKKANELFFLGQPFYAQQALEMGFINKVIASQQVDQHALSIAHKLLKQPQAALIETKKLLKYQQSALKNQLQLEIKAFEKFVQSDEARTLFENFLG